MTAVTTDSVSRIAELSDSAFAAFCEDLAGMFGVDMECERRQVQPMAVADLRGLFKKLTAVHVTKADGALDGKFQLIFDQGGLFILSGVVVMLPESRIVEEVKCGSMEDATNLQDAAREVGNLLVGAWDRVFREDCPGHRHFVKASTVIGKPWDKPEQLELQADAEVLTVLYEMTVEPYPAFTCAAVFTLDVLRGLQEPPERQGKSNVVKKSDETDEAVATSAEATPVPMQSPTPTPLPPPAAPEKPPEPVACETPAASGAGEDDAHVAHTSPEKPAPTEGSAPAPAEGIAAMPQGRPFPGPETPAPNKGLIRPTPRSPSIDAGMLPSELASGRSGGAARRPDLSFLDDAYIQSRPGTGPAEFLSTPAAEIMEKEVIWAGPEDTVQDVISKMQQYNVGYVLIGSNGVLDGLVSGSNVLGAVSLYLRPTFARWRRPQDDATLGVKVKWIMSRPVRTVRPDATLAAMIESMRRCGGRCLPVVDATGAVQGIVTVFDILLRILEFDKSVSWRGRPPQAPPLLI